MFSACRLVNIGMIELDIISGIPLGINIFTCPLYLLLELMKGVN